MRFTDHCSSKRYSNFSPKIINEKTIYMVPLQWDEFKKWHGKYRGILITSSPYGKKLRKPVYVDLTWINGRGDLDILNYILCSLLGKQPSLIPFILANKSILKLVKHLRRHRSSSHRSLLHYTYNVRRFMEWIGLRPDQAISRILDIEGLPKQKEVKWIRDRIEEYVGELLSQGLSPKTINAVLSSIKSFFEINGVQIGRIPKPRLYEKYRPRSPTPEEIQRLIEVADIRGKVIIAILATSGIRISTLAALKYRHVEKDLEKNIVPIHIHIDAEITKGKYGDYDTFINREAAEYLKLYLDLRRRGSPSKKIPGEKIDGDSPLIRNSRKKYPRPIGVQQIYKIIHNLYFKAGLVSKSFGRRYELCAHSLRKYFKTQMTAAGVPQDIVEYMMGHRTSTYLDVKCLGVEKLREIYIKSGISIKPKTMASRIEILKEMIRSLGFDPEKILVKEALKQPYRTVVERRMVEMEQLETLQTMLRKLIMREAGKQS